MCLAVVQRPEKGSVNTETGDRVMSCLVEPNQVLLIALQPFSHLFLCCMFLEMWFHFVDLPRIWHVDQAGLKLPEIHLLLPA